MRHSGWKRILFVLLLAMICLMAGIPVYGGGPRWIAGSSYFNASAKGKPVVWAGGQIAYYFDQGDLSATVTKYPAEDLVNAAMNSWSSVATAAVKFTYNGTLAEDVSGTNVTVGPNGIKMPADMQPTATNRPLGIIFDTDGSVINAFFGAGASLPALCQQNGVMTKVDNISPSGNILHALIFINGLCTATTAQVTVLKYQLLRGVGQILGLDWSQANEEMFAANQVSSAGLAGWPIMHPIERLCNATGQSCIPNGAALRLDDVAALNRTYPVTAENIGLFSGKKLTAANTISVQGRIQFKRGQGMQGVNAVLRPMIAGTDLPDVRYTVTAVSGAYFQGNAGNPITGATDASGNAVNRYGSDDETVEGFFDVSGIPLPAGRTSANYQLTFEAVDPLDTGGASVGSYTTGQVTPSGTMPTIYLPALAPGSSVYKVVNVDDSADETLSGNDGSEAEPTQLSVSGEWTARISGYGHTGWLQWRPRANREFTVEVTALDEHGRPTVNKAQPVLGVWNSTDSGTVAPAMGTSQPFNGVAVGLTELQVITTADGEVRLGVADMRGDGRPDFLYRGRVIYADTVQPSRLPAIGGPIVIRGVGLRQNSVVMVNNLPAVVTSVSPTEITAVAPPSGGATGNVLVEVQDPQTLGLTIIADGLSYNAQNGDELAIVTAPANTVAMGVPIPFTVKSMNWDNRTPAAGVSVSYSVTQGIAAMGCGQSVCTATTAGDGTATVMVSASSTALAQVTASLTNGASIAAEFSGQASPTITAITPNLYLAIGGTSPWNPQGLVLNNGLPVGGKTVNWDPMGSGVNAQATASVSAADGVVTQKLMAGPLNEGDVVPVNACLAGGSACAQFNVVAVHTQTAQLVAESGTSQTVAATESFAPVVLEVTDAIGHPMAGAAVTFYETLNAWTPACSVHGACPPAPLLAQESSQLVSGADGMVTLIPLSIAGEPSRLHVIAVAGESAILDFELDKHP
jgi:hypothetical protein